MTAHGLERPISIFQVGSMLRRFTSAEANWAWGVSLDVPGQRLLSPGNDFGTGLGLGRCLL